MRALIAAVALAFVAACDGSVGTESLEGGPESGYSVEIRANGDQQTFLVRAPDGRTVGSQVVDGVSSLMDEASVQSLAASAAPTGEPADEVMALRVPGFSMNIAADENPEGEQGRAQINMNAGNFNMSIDADEGAIGEGDDRAVVRFSGFDEEAIRQFIADADDLSPATQAEMLAGLGL
jgi:hypothetical protein